MTEMIKNTLIRCVVTDANDMLSDNIAMPASYVDRLLGGWHDRGCYLDEAVKNVRAKSAMPLNSPRDVTLCRILSLASDSAFDEVSGAQAVFFDGWSEDALAGTERVCLLPEFMLPQARTDGDGSLWLDVSAGEVNTSLRVIGTDSGQTGARSGVRFTYSYATEYPRASASTAVPSTSVTMPVWRKTRK